MKDLKNFIWEYIDLYDNNVVINDSLDQHLYAEFILKESLRYDPNIINEQHGSYIGQKELIIALSKDIFKLYKFNQLLDKLVLDANQLKDYKNVFFKKLIIKFTKDTRFVNSLSKYNKSDNLFDSITIEINKDEIKSYQDICSILMHEFLHAYNEYIGYTKDYIKFKLSDLTQVGSAYDKTLDSKYSKNTPEYMCKNTLNLLRKFEQNAYLSELTIEIENLKFSEKDFENTIEAYKSAKKQIMQSDTMQVFLIAYKYLKNLKSNEDKKLYVDTYNDINNINITFEKMYKKLIYLFEEFFKRAEVRISQLFYDKYASDLFESYSKNGSSVHDRSFIKYMKMYEELGIN